MKINFVDLPALTKLPVAQPLILTVGAAEKSGTKSAAAAFGPLGKQLDKTTNGQLMAALRAAPRFTGAHGDSLTILAPKGLSVTRIVLLGVGNMPDRLAKSHDCQLLGAAACKALSGTGDVAATLLVDLPRGYTTDAAAVANIAGGVFLKSYRFDKYRTKLARDKKPVLNSITVHSPNSAEAKREFRNVQAIVEGMCFTRDLGNEPPNILYPVTAAAEAQKLTALGLTVEVLDEKQMAKIGMGSLLMVAQGSAHKPRLVIVSYKGAGDKSAPVALIGKGVTFDTGGNSLKPSGSMAGMKYDMLGAGCVLGAMRSLAQRKARVNVIGLCGFVENSCDGNAYRPDDVLTSLSGQTIENLNTDAEGRLVLCDVLTYTQQRFKPRAMLNFATLTGAAIVALGHEFACIMGNNEDLLAKVQAAGLTSGDRCWPLPLDEAYDRHIDSHVADMKNIGNPGEAGTIIGGTFLNRFVDKKIPWVHVDIAGTADRNSEQPLSPRGATGFGVRLVNQLMMDVFES